MHAVIVSGDDLRGEKGGGNLQGAEDAHGGRELERVHAAVLGEDELVDDAAHRSEGGGYQRCGESEEEQEAEGGLRREAVVSELRGAREHDACRDDRGGDERAAVERAELGDVGSHGNADCATSDLQV